MCDACTSVSPAGPIVVWRSIVKCRLTVLQVYLLFDCVQVQYGRISAAPLPFAASAEVLGLPDSVASSLIYPGLCPQWPSALTQLHAPHYLAASSRQSAAKVAQLSVAICSFPSCTMTLFCSLQPPSCWQKWTSARCCQQRPWSPSQPRLLPGSSGARRRLRPRLHVSVVRQQLRWLLQPGRVRRRCLRGSSR